MEESKKKRQFKTSVIVLAVFLIVSLVGGLSAKYIYESNEKNLISAKVFYFESNLLRDSHVEYILNPTATSITFTVSNGIDELRYSDDSIHYTVAYEVDGVKTTLPDADCVLENGQVSTDSVTIDGLQKGKTYKVNVIGKAGYKKVLQADFTVSDTDKNIYKHVEQKDGYVLLTVWTENLSGDVQIEFPAGLIPDGTDSILRNVKNYEDSQYKAAIFKDTESFEKVYSSRTYRFFVDGNKMFSENDFIVTKIEGSVIALAGSGKLN